MQCHFLTPLRSPVTELVYKLKGGVFPEESHWLGQALALSYVKAIEESPQMRRSLATPPLLLTPPPSKKPHGDHATALALGVQALLGGSIDTRCMERMPGAGNPQKQQSKLERFSASFKCREDWPVYEGPHIFLVDDVLTTGATLWAMQMALYQIYDQRRLPRISALCLAYKP